MDYYHVLGVNKNATEASIRRAFRCRAKLLHPDVNKGTRAKHDFQLANQAYQVLKDTNKRRLYDLRINSGRYSQKVYYRPGQTTHSNPKTYHAYSYGDPPTDYKPTRLEKIFDQFLFFSMLMMGLSALFYGIYRALGEPVEGVNPYVGIIFGVIFTVIFIFGWDKMQRLKTKSD
jgi:curved DNA-binding protein CbpA